MRTYSRDAWLEAMALWDDGEYGYRWGTVRKLAKDRGSASASGLTDD